MLREKIFSQDKYILLLLFSIAITIIYNLSILAYSPLPWFDEVFFASITHSYIENGLFNLSLAPLYNSSEVLTYGPVYFVLNSFIINILGFGIFQFRLLNFLANTSAIFILSLILKKYNIPVKERLLLILIYLLDAMYIINSHSGRMDGVAVFFMLFFTYLVLNYNKNFWILPLSGVFFGLAVLTTPRAIFFMIPIIFYYVIKLLLNWKKDRNLLRLITWAIPPLFLYFLWIFSKFGSINAFFDYYLQEKLTDQGQGSTLDTFIHFSPYINPLEYHVVYATIISFMVLFFKNIKNIPAIVFIFICNILLFYGFILDTGMYSIFILPFFYFIIFISLNLSKINNKLKYGIILILLLFNFSTFILKNTGIILDFNHRNYKALNKLFDENIPQNAKVVGSEVFFYAAIQNKNNFQTIERGSNWWDRYKYHAEVFDFEYLILSEQFYLAHKGILEIYHTKDMELIKKINFGEMNNSLTLKISNFLDITSPTYSYNGLIFKRKKNTK